jgi:hypothetical protein
MIRRALLCTAPLFTALCSTTLVANAAPITASMTGAWFDPTRSGQGIQIQVVGSSQKELLLYWYTYDQAGNPIWLVAQAPITDDIARLTALEVRGPRFMEQNAVVNVKPFAELELSFDDCGKAKMHYSTAFATGDMQLSRLSSTFGDQCTGTLLDDRRPVTTTQTDATSVSSGLTVSTRYREEPGKISFKVTARGTAAQAGGRYQVWILGAQRAEIQMLASGGESEAEVEFASPAQAGKLPLTFDPRGAAVELRNASGGVVPPPAGSGAPPFGNSDQRVPLNFAPAFGNGSGEARLKRLSNKVSFSVEVEDVPIGTYSIRVANVHRGTLLVSAQNGRNKGELEFSNPQDAGKPLLSFDPRGQLVQVISGTETVASVTFVN